MKVLRHILSHLILILLILAVVSVFYYRTLLLPNDVVANINGIVKEIYPPALRFTSKRDYFWSIRGERIVSFDHFNVFEKDNDVVSDNNVDELAKAELDVKPDEVSQDVPTVELEVEKEAVESEVVVKSTVEPEKSGEVIKDKTTDTELVIAATAKTDNSLAQTKQPVETIDKNNKAEDLLVEVKDSDTSSERELLISARSAFNNGAMAKSEKYYIQLTELDNFNADIYGELGNVYYSQGKWDKAGQAYYEAAVRLIEKGNYNQAIYLQRVISGLNTEHAEKLAQLMMRR